MRITTTVIFTFVLVVPNLAFAWGDTGHRIICEIAFAELADSARNEVKRLIAMDDEFTTFSDSCIWPDHPRKRAEEHYINFPRDTKQVTRNKCLLADKCTFTAINHDLKDLRKHAFSDADKLEAIKYLGHWVGDIHQPLHVSFQDDRGGNRVKTTGLCNGNLHGTWDTCMIHRDILKKPRTKKRVRHLARKLIREISAEQRNQWKTNRVSTWANESYQIVTSPKTDYCDLVNGTCVYSNRTNRWVQGAERRVVIDRDYLGTNVPIIRDQLKKAGVRLAFLMNKSF